MIISIPLKDIMISPGKRFNPAEHTEKDVINSLMVQKGDFQQAEVLFKQAIKSGNIPNAYYGLAFLYRMAGEFEASKGVLETMFVRIPQESLTKEHAAIYTEARNLYSEVSKDKKN